MKALQITLLLTLGGATLTGCGTVGVKPWERDILSRSDMRPDGAGLDDAIDEHLYFSKEASSGGRSFGGGGCGCN
jgi:hypothetical protein